MLRSPSLGSAGGESEIGNEPRAVKGIRGQKLSLEVAGRGEGGVGGVEAPP